MPFSLALQVSKLCDLHDEGDTVTSVSWSDRVSVGVGLLICCTSCTSGSHFTPDTVRPNQCPDERAVLIFRVWNRGLSR